MINLICGVYRRSAHYVAGAIQTYDEGKRTRFVLTQKESKILYEIQHKLNIGVVKHFPQGKSEASHKNKDFYRLIVDNPSHILLLAFMFNGNLAQEHRIKQLSLWVNALNNRYGHQTIQLNDTPVSITLQDGWLSGFTYAEGCFNVSITKNFIYTLGHVVKMLYMLDQKDIDILNKVCEILGRYAGKVSLRSSTENVYRFTATFRARPEDLVLGFLVHTSLKSMNRRAGFKVLNNVIAYFNLFPA